MQEKKIFSRRPKAGQILSANATNSIDLPGSAGPYFENSMKICAQCGMENEESALACKQCGATFAPGATKPRIENDRYEFAKLAPEDKDKDLVTLLTCTTPTMADFIVSELEGADLPASSPDSLRMLSGPFELDQVYKYRVQIAPEHFEAAKEFLSAEASEPTQNPPGA